MNITMTAALVSIPFAPAFAGNPEQRVFVKDSEIYVTERGSAEARRLTSDGIPKGFPALSADGSRVAFVRTAEKAMGDIVALSADGTLLHEIRFRPQGSGTSGMRFIEGLQWMSNKFLVVFGSVNPSTTEYAVVDAESGKEVSGYMVDGYGWAVSPDGSHVAYVGYVPHWTPVERRRPQLCIDDECLFDKPSRGYPAYSVHVEFTRPPEWSPDGTAVAIAAEEYKTKVKIVIVRQLGGKTLQYAPPGAEDGLGMAWDQKALVVKTANGNWRLEPGTATFAPSR